MGRSRNLTLLLVGSITALILLVFLAESVRKSKQNILNNRSAATPLYPAAENGIKANRAPVTDDLYASNRSSPERGAGLILFKRGISLFVMDGDGEKQRRITANGSVAALSPDATKVAYYQKDVIRSLSLSDDRTTEITHLSGDQHVISMAWSPTSESLGYVTVEILQRGGPPTYKLYLLSLPDGRLRGLGEAGGPDSMTFSSDPSQLVSISADRKKLERIAIEDGTRKTFFEIKERGQELHKVKFAPDGLKIAFISVNSDGSSTTLMVLELSSNKTSEIHYRSLPSRFSTVYDFDWSPDSQFIAVGVGNYELGYPPSEGLIYISSVDQTRQDQLTFNCVCLQPKFSPDGKSVIYTNFTGNASGLYRLQLSIKKTKRLTNPGNVAQESVIDWR